MGEIFVSGRKELIQKLLKSDYEFKRLYIEHRDLDDQLDRLIRKRHRSESEELKVKRMQKQKLRQKDNMERILRSNVQNSEAFA